MLVKEIVNESLPGGNILQKTRVNLGLKSKRQKTLEKAVNNQFKIWLKKASKLDLLKNPNAYFNHFIKHIINSPGINDKSFLKSEKWNNLSDLIQNDIKTGNINKNKLKNHMQGAYNFIFNYTSDVKPVQKDQIKNQPPAPGTAPRAPSRSKLITWPPKDNLVVKFKTPRGYYPAMWYNNRWSIMTKSGQVVPIKNQDILTNKYKKGQYSL